MVFKFLDSIKGMFFKTVPYNINSDIAKNNALVLAEMCWDARFLSASNNRSYFYYFCNNLDDVDFAEFLFRRNGIKMERHFSRLTYDRRLVLRVPASTYEKSRQKKEFLDAILQAYGQKTEITNDARVEAALAYSKYLQK